MDILESIKLIIFDLDGTLVHLPIDWENIKELVKLEPAQKLGDKLEQLKLDRQTETLDKITDMEVQALSQSEARPDVESVLLELAQKYNIAIFTRNSKKVVEKFLIPLLGAQTEQIFIIGREDVVKLKPDPEGISLILKHFDTKAGQAVLVGDTFHDIEAARAIGLKSIVIKNPNLEYVPKGADQYIMQLSELLG